MTHGWSKELDLKGKLRPAVFLLHYLCCVTVLPPQAALLSRFSWLDQLGGTVTTGEQQRCAKHPSFWQSCKTGINKACLWVYVYIYAHTYIHKYIHTHSLEHDTRTRSLNVGRSYLWICQNTRASASRQTRSGSRAAVSVWLTTHTPRRLFTRTQRTGCSGCTPGILLWGFFISVSLVRGSAPVILQDDRKSRTNY